jgi:hypothetical protein
MSVLESPADTEAVEPTPPPIRHRRAVRWAIAAVIVLVIAAGSAFLVKVRTEHAIGWAGGSDYVSGADAVRHDDPFGAEPSGGWAEVTYSHSGTFELGFSITNMSHSQSIKIRTITWEDLRHGDSESPLASATLNIHLGGGTGPLTPFRPFTLGPRQQAYIQWTFTMCPNATVQKGGSIGIANFRVDYTYFGLPKSQDVPLALPLQVDDWAGGC